jgi:hypothetical protein
MEMGVTNHVGRAALIAGIVSTGCLMYSIGFLLVAVPIAAASHLNPYLLSAPIALGPIAALTGVVCGHIARRRDRRAGGPATEGTVALAGLLLSYGYWAFLIVIVGGGFLTFQSIR